VIPGAALASAGGSPEADAAIAAIVDAIADTGCAIAPHFLPPAAIAVLRAEAWRRDAAGALVPAAVGRGAARSDRRAVRGDRILWLDATAPATAERVLLTALEALRLAANRELQLGLFEYEGHYALYPPGAFYARHLDRFRDDDARTLSCILYLNEDWRPEDGGALRLHVDGAPRDVLPAGGTLVAFLAERFEHEVLPAARPRLAVTGWFMRRAVSRAAF
jgi:SM-20-related protein